MERRPEDGRQGVRWGEAWQPPLRLLEDKDCSRPGRRRQEATEGQGGGEGGPAASRREVRGLQKVQLVGLFDGRRSQESSPLLPRLWLAWGAALHSSLGLPPVENKEVGFSNLAFLGPSVWSSHFNPLSSGASRSHAPATDPRGGRSRLGGWGRLGWELAGAAGPQMTSENQLDLARQRRKRGEGSPPPGPPEEGR